MEHHGADRNGTIKSTLDAVMHLLSAHNRSEFLATPQLVRFAHAEGDNGLEATLLIKASSLLLKYIVQGARMEIAFFQVLDRLAYALRVHDDPQSPATLWSVLERDEETDALNALAKGEACTAFLFSELAVNVAWASLRPLPASSLAEMVTDVRYGPVDHSALKQDVSSLLEMWYRDKTVPSGLSLDLPLVDAWKPLQSTYITNRGGTSLIDLFNTDEGRQQEQLALWLTDGLHLGGAYQNPETPGGTGWRELTDLLLTYEHGTFLIESKTLTILSRKTLPSRAKLARDVSKHIEKAGSQLRGAIRQLRTGAEVRSNSGQDIVVERTQPMHAIMLIPDLDLVLDPSAFDQVYMRQFAIATSGFLHLLDIGELLRVVQAAEMISARGSKTTPMMAFDFYLVKRFEQAMKSGTLRIEVLLRFDNAKQ